MNGSPKKVKGCRRSDEVRGELESEVDGGVSRQRQGPEG